MNDILEPMGISCFDVKWQSIQYSDIGMSVGMGLGKFVVTEALSLLVPGGKAVKLASLLTNAMKIKTIVYDSLISETSKKFK